MSFQGLENSLKPGGMCDEASMRENKCIVSCIYESAPTFTMKRVLERTSVSYPAVMNLL